MKIDKWTILKGRDAEITFTPIEQPNHEELPRVGEIYYNDGSPTGMMEVLFVDFFNLPYRTAELRLLWKPWQPTFVVF